MMINYKDRPPPLVTVATPVKLSSLKWHTLYAVITVADYHLKFLVISDTVGP